MGAATPMLMPMLPASASLRNLRAAEPLLVNRHAMLPYLPLSTNWMASSTVFKCTIPITGPKTSVEAMVLRERDPGGSGIVLRLRQVVTDVPKMVERFGPLGLGLGTMTQGSRYFGADVRWGIASESGPYRLAVELGVAGVIVVAFIGLRLARRMYRALKDARRWPQARAVLAAGLLVLIAANGAVFLTAHQIFGDPFVFLWLGLVAGFAFTQIAGGIAERRAAAAGGKALLPVSEGPVPGVVQVQGT